MRRFGQLKVKMREVVLLVLNSLFLLLVRGQLRGDIMSNIAFSESTVYEEGFVTDHYERIAEEYGRNAHGTMAPIQTQLRNMIESIYNNSISDLDNNEAVVDMGGGDCVTADKLAQALRKKVWCIEPYMNVNVSTFANINYMKMDAIKFTSSQTIRYNFILFNGVIHHIPHDDYSTIFTNIHHQLLSDGALVIMTRPKAPYLFYSNLFKQRWASTSADLDVILPAISNAGFQVSSESHNFTMTINKSDWKQFILDRTWSTFETLSEDEMQREFTELDRAHPGAQFNFIDNCIFIIATKK